MSPLGVVLVTIVAFWLIFSIVLALGLARVSGKPTPPMPGSLQARVDALRAMGEQVDEVFRDDYEPGPVRRLGGGWRV